MHKATLNIHHPYKAPEAFEATQPAIHKASTVFFPSVAAMHSRDWTNKSAYTYGLHGTPTTFALEEKLCSLEGGQHCLLVPSGLAAIAQVNIALLKAGDEVLIPDNAYGPNKAFAVNELERWGVGHQIYDPLNLDDLRSKIHNKTKLVWLEAPGSITMEFPDLIEMARLCREQGVLSALDNTWGAGLAFQPFDLTANEGDLAVDISVHALTKYPSGGGDVLMGSIMTCDDALSMQIKLSHMRMGFGAAANDAELILRSLPSLTLRYEAQDKVARELAVWCQSRPEVSQVLHPALPDAPGHQNWKRLCTGRFQTNGNASHPVGGSAAGLFSLVLNERFSSQQVHLFCETLQHFRLGYSWGGPCSLVVPYDLSKLRQSWPIHVAKGHVVRLAIGLEDLADLRQDLAQAMDCCLRS